MSQINRVVQEAMSCGYLTADAERTLCQYFDGNCNLHDVTALTMLQRALSSGQVKRLSQGYLHTYTVYA